MATSFYSNYDMKSENETKCLGFSVFNGDYKESVVELKFLFKAIKVIFCVVF